MFRKLKNWLTAQRASAQIKREAQVVATVMFVNKSGFLDQLCDKFGSDKAGDDPTRRFQWLPHMYGDFYEWLLGGYRERVKLVFECGIGTCNAAFGANMGPSGAPGASLRVWREFFPNAEIFGADIDESVMFEENRISTGIIDQTDVTSIQRYWASINRTDFDLMIDDGLHEVEAGMTLFENSYSWLKSDGIYVIEDVRRSSVPAYITMAKNCGFSAIYVGFGSDRYGHNSADGLMIFKRQVTVDLLGSV